MMTETDVIMLQVEEGISTVASQQKGSWFGCVEFAYIPWACMGFLPHS